MARSTKELRVAVGAAIRQLRHEKGISQKQLGRLCNFSSSFPSALEGGLRMASIQTLLRIAKALQISATEIVARAEMRLRPELDLPLPHLPVANGQLQHIEITGDRPNVE
jgi:transcriptional regulator with XRE-family HTH domain